MTSSNQSKPVIDRLRVVYMFHNVNRLWDIKAADLFELLQVGIHTYCVFNSKYVMSIHGWDIDYRFLI